MLNTMVIESKIDGKKVTLELTQNEVASALSICEKNSMESVIVMKRPSKGGALFFTDPRKAAACQDRHNFEFSFSVKLSELKKFEPSDVPTKVVDKNAEAIQGLKDLVAVLRDEATAKDKVIKENKKAVESVEAKDGEIVTLKASIVEKDAELVVLAELEASIGEKDTEIALQVEAIAEKDAEIAELKK